MVFDQQGIPLTLISVGFLGVSFEVWGGERGGGKITPFLKLARIMPEA